MAKLNENGHEVLDPTPLALPAGFKRPEPLADMMRRLVRTELSRRAEDAGLETFEESEDFDVDDDSLPGTPFEEFFDPALGRGVTAAEVLRDHASGKRYEARTEARMAPKPPNPSPSPAGAPAPASAAPAAPAPSGAPAPAVPPAGASPAA